MIILNRTDKMGYCLAPKRLVDLGLKVRFMYREKPDDADDSGWRFFSGDEDDEYVNNPDNIGLYDVNTILAIDKDVGPFLGSPDGSAFERDDSAMPFVPCDFDFGE